MNFKIKWKDYGSEYSKSNKTIDICCGQIENYSKLKMVSKQSEVLKMTFGPKFGHLNRTKFGNKSHFIFHSKINKFYCIFKLPSINSGSIGFITS
jgi:hypothetical protein